MKYTPEERRKKLLALAELDPDYRGFSQEFGPAKKKFEKFVDRIPFWSIRNLLNTYPGIGTLLHNRLIRTACETMRFPEEDCQT